MLEMTRILLPILPHQRRMRHLILTVREMMGGSLLLHCTLFRHLPIQRKSLAVLETKVKVPRSWWSHLRCQRRCPWRLKGF